MRVIALDGPAGSGKTTVAALTAAALGWCFVDTGATYRAATLAVLRAGVPLDDPVAVTAAVAAARIELSTDPDARGVLLDGEDVSSEIRGAPVTAAVSAVSAVPEVRRLLVVLQRQAIDDGLGRGGAVVEGRDIATVVAPDAGLKVYLDARPEVRAQRRAGQARTAGASRGEPQTVHLGGSHADPHTDSERVSVVEASLLQRDAQDAQTNKLEPARGAVHLETSDLTLNQVVDAVVALAAQAGLTVAAAGTASVRASVTASRAPQARTRVAARGRRQPWLIAACRPFGWVLFHTAFRLRVVGREHVPAEGAVLLAGNHTGFLDGPLVFALSPRSATFLAKSELFVGPLARVLGWLGQIPVHRGRPDRAALRSGLRVLQAGGALGVFPEGTRGEGTLEEVSDGVAYLALRSGAPLVPLAVLGTKQAMPKGSWLPRWRAPVSLVFGPAFEVDVPGDPRARRTVRAAAEQIRLGLVAHVGAASTDHAAHADSPRSRSQQ